MNASLLLSALQVLNVDLMTDEEDALVWNSENMPLSPVFLSRLKAHIHNLKGRLKLRCRKCHQVSICEEGSSYFIAYCPNGHGYIRKEPKTGFTLDEALADWQQIQFEAEERLALMTENGRDETDVLNEICQQIILDLFTDKKAYE